jgi:peptidoglycan/xylan/chitin deacetylase (PgdA/CDA1 family)
MDNASSVFEPLTKRVRGQRGRLANGRLRVERWSLARWGKARHRDGGRILAYHSTGTAEWGVNDVLPGRFIEQIDLASRLGYRFVGAAEIASGAGKAQDLAITFDDGLRSILAVTPYLERHGIPFAVFPVAGWTSNPADRFLSWKELGELAAAGATVGSHSMTHANFTGLPLERRKAELEDSRAVIAQQLGVVPTLFAIPFGRGRDWDGQSTALAQEVGYTAILAQSEHRRPVGTVGRSFISRFDGPGVFRAVLEGRFDGWEEWF